MAGPGSRWSRRPLALVGGYSSGGAAGARRRCGVARHSGGPGGPGAPVRGLPRQSLRGPKAVRGCPARRRVLDAPGARTGTARAERRAPEGGAGLPGTPGASGCPRRPVRGLRGRRGGLPKAVRGCPARRRGLNAPGARAGTSRVEAAGARRGSADSLGAETGARRGPPRCMPSTCVAPGPMALAVLSRLAEVWRMTRVFPSPAAGGRPQPLRPAVPPLRRAHGGSRPGGGSVRAAPRGTPDHRRGGRCPRSDPEGRRGHGRRRRRPRLRPPRRRGAASP